MTATIPSRWKPPSRRAFSVGTPVQWVPYHSMGIPAVGTVAAQTFPGMPEGTLTVHGADGMPYAVHYARLTVLHVRHALGA